MRKIAAALVTALIVAAPYSAMAEGQDFTIRNNTPWDIHQLYVSPANDNSWEDDILEETVAAGDKTDINFDDVTDEECMWDVKIVDEEGDEWIVEDIDLCEVSHLVFYKQGDRVMYKTE